MIKPISPLGVIAGGFCILFAMVFSAPAGAQQSAWPRIRRRTRRPKLNAIPVRPAVLARHFPAR